jgi:hypothetical protein
LSFAIKLKNSKVITLNQKKKKKNSKMKRMGGTMMWLHLTHLSMNFAREIKQANKVFIEMKAMNVIPRRKLQVP